MRITETTTTGCTILLHSFILSARFDQSCPSSEDPSNLSWNVKQVLHIWFLRGGGERKTAAPAGLWLTAHHILQPSVSPDDLWLTQSDIRDNRKHAYDISGNLIQPQDPLHFEKYTLVFPDIIFFCFPSWVSSRVLCVSHKAIYVSIKQIKQSWLFPWHLVCSSSGAVTSGMDLYVENLAEDSKRRVFNWIHSEACETEMSLGKNLQIHTHVPLSCDLFHRLK